jgi:glycosyltransferase involved in cell wall biosynthesis
MRIAVVGNGRSVHVTGRSAAVAARGHAVRMVTVGDVLAVPGVEVRTRPLPRDPLSAVAAAHGFLRDVWDFRPDLLHLHYAGGKLGTMALLSGVRPMVVTVMGGDVLPEQHLGGYSRLERRATRRILEAADLGLVKADALRPAVAAFGISADRVETVRWGVDPEVFRRDERAADVMRRRLGLAATDRVIASPRPLAPLYNVHLIVEALPAILRTVPAAMLLIAEYGGDAAYRRAVEERAVALDLRDRVRFVGRLEHGDMPAFYSLADVVVNVPSSDGLPQSLFEAMSCQAPVVLGRLPAYGEVVQDGETALLADLSAEGVADAVARLLTDAELRERLAEGGRRRVGQLASLPREAERVEQMYGRILGPPRAKPWGRLVVGSILDTLGLLVR